MRRIPSMRRVFAPAAAAAVAIAGARAQAGAPARDTEAEQLRRRLDAVEQELQRFTSGQAPAAPNQRDYQPEKVPFAWGDFSWMPGGYAPADSLLKFGPFTGELRVDTAYHY